MSGSTDVGPFSIVPRWVREGCRGKPMALALYCLLADKADRNSDNGWTISRTMLMRELGVSIASVDRCVSHLESIGALEVEHQRKESNPKEWGWSRYVIRMARPQGVSSPVRVPLPSPERGPTLTSDDASTEPHKIRTNLLPACGRGVAPKEDQVDFGADPDKVKEPPKGRKPAGFILGLMNACWPEVVVAVPEYRNHKVTDSAAFAKYLNDTFFGPQAKTPLTQAEVATMVERFLADLRRREFRLKDGQPVWMAFTRRWQNYTPTVSAQTAAKRTWEVYEV